MRRTSARWRDGEPRIVLLGGLIRLEAARDDRQRGDRQATASRAAMRSAPRSSGPQFLSPPTARHYIITLDHAGDMRGWENWPIVNPTTEAVDKFQCCAYRPLALEIGGPGGYGSGRFRGEAALRIGRRLGGTCAAPKRARTAMADRIVPLFPISRRAGDRNRRRVHARGAKGRRSIIPTFSSTWATPLRSSAPIARPCSATMAASIPTRRVRRSVRSQTQPDPSTES